MYLPRNLQQFGTKMNNANLCKGGITNGHFLFSWMIGPVMTTMPNNTRICVVGAKSQRVQQRKMDHNDGLIAINANDRAYDRADRVTQVDIRRM